MPYKFALLLLFFLPTLVFSQGKTLLIIGDSLSAAYGINEQQGWPHLLQQRLDEEKYNYQVINASISGETSAGGLSRLPQLLQKTNATVTIIALGANDGLRGLPLKQMRKNLRLMIQLSYDYGNQVLLAGMLLPPNYGKVYNQSFFRSFAALAEEQETAYLPFLLKGLENEKKFFQADGLHPTAAAQKKILENIWNPLQELISAGNKSLEGG